MKVFWNNEKHKPMELFLDLPFDITEKWVQIGFDFMMEERLVDIYINSKKIFFIMDFSTVPFEILQMGGSSHFPSESCNCVFQNFILYNHQIEQNKTFINENVIDFKFDKNQTEQGMNLIKKGEKLLKLDNLDGLELLHQAKRMGNTKAVKRLAEVNFFGEVMEPDFESAFKFFQNCSSNDSLCLYYASLFLNYPLTKTGRNAELSLFYLSLSVALNGEMQSQFSLAHKYYYGIGMRKNHFISNYYYHNAAQYAFWKWQQTGLKDTQYYSLESHFIHTMDGQRAKHEDDEMLEIEKYKAEVGDDAFSAEWVSM